jgi:hypothetical protein
MVASQEMEKRVEDALAGSRPSIDILRYHGK